MPGRGLHGDRDLSEPEMIRKLPDLTVHPNEHPWVIQMRDNLDRSTCEAMRKEVEEHLIKLVTITAYPCL